MIWRSILFATSLAICATSADAQVRCAPTGIVEMRLPAAYQEQIIDEETRPGHGDPDLLILWRVWASAKTRTWTLTGTARGSTCVFRAGENYAGQMVSDFLDAPKPKPANEIPI